MSTTDHVRLAATDPHLVSLGGGRLSTAVTIHNIPVGDTTIGSSIHNNISLIGAGIFQLHCTLYRSEDNQVTLVPERGARILIDGQLIQFEVDLKQGAMITLGEAYYLRYNNPAQAQQIRTAMGERFNQFENEQATLDHFYETNINPLRSQEKLNESFGQTYNNWKPIDMNWQCPKVFTADLVTVNMPAKAVLGQKYANFAKNLAENHRKDKNVNTKHNEGLYVNIPNNSISLTDSCEILSKIQNTTASQKKTTETGKTKFEMLDSKDHLEDMLKICSEYTDRNGSQSSSPIVQNRIKTNGSLPRDKKSPFCQEFSNQLQKSFDDSGGNSLTASPKKSSGYENVRILAQNQVEILHSPNSSGYENVRLVPQSPRTKIRTNCMSPKKESNFSSTVFNTSTSSRGDDDTKPQTNYEDLIKSFEDKFQKEIQAIEESTRSPPPITATLSANSTPLVKRSNTNINNLTIDIKTFVSPYNSPKPIKKPTPAPRNITKPLNSLPKEMESMPDLHWNHQQARLHNEREELLQRLHTLKMEISVLQQQDNEALIEMDMENALVSGELQSLNESKHKLEYDYKVLQQRIHRLEAQRNATRVMEENQQAKLKQSIEMKQDQVQRLKEMLKQNPHTACLKEELGHVRESLDNDRKAFEDLEFQYLEGESEWHAQRDELYIEDISLAKQLQDTKTAIENLEKEENTSTSEQQNALRNRLVTLLNDLQQCELQFRELERKLAKQNNTSSLASQTAQQSGLGSVSSLAVMSQSLFGSTEMLCPKVNTEDLMSKSFNENMIYNNKIEMPRNSLQIVPIINKRLKSQESLKDAVDRTSKDATNKIIECIKEIERNRKLLATKQGERTLELEKRKIEEILAKLNSETKQQYLSMINTSAEESPTKDNKENQQQQKRNSSISYEKQAVNVTEKLSPSAGSSQQRPLSESNSEIVDDYATNIKRQSIRESSAHSPRSPESSRSLRSSSVLSNETSSHGGDSSIASERRKLINIAKQQRPLTRYLPIFAQDLDLRRHIESAGHQITLCPHVFIDAYTCRGYLHKLGSTFHTWSKRWFVLDRQRNALIYYSDKYERKPRGGAYFSSIDEVYMDHLNASKSSRPHSTFIVKTKKRIYYLQASSDSAARIWIDSIITGAQGNIDY